MASARQRLYYVAAIVVALWLALLLLSLRRASHRDDGHITCEFGATQPPARDAPNVIGTQRSLANFDGFIMRRTNSELAYLPLNLSRVFTVDSSSFAVDLIMDLECAALTSIVQFAGSRLTNADSDSYVRTMKLSLSAGHTQLSCRFDGIVNIVAFRGSHYRCARQQAFECLGADNSSVTLVVRRIEYEVGSREDDTGEFETQPQDCPS